MKLKPERRRHLAIFAGALLGVSLIAFAGVHVVRWMQGGSGPVAGESVKARRVALSEAPFEVQEAAAKLASSRVAYVMPWGSHTYVVVSTGEGGERIEIAGAVRDPSFPPSISLNLRSGPGGDRLVIAGMSAAATNPQAVRIFLDGYAGALPMLVNTDSVPLTALPHSGSLTVASPEAGVRVMGNMVQVSGFARLPSGRFSVQVFSAGKGRVLGEYLDARASAGAPDWGSYRVNVPFTLPPGVLEGVVLIYDQQSGAKVAIPVRFSSK